MSTEQIYIIDETPDQDDRADYNPMLDPSLNMGDFIEIYERSVPGKKVSFNNMADVKTKEVSVTGLVLHFSQDMADSRLRAIIGRTDIEFLYLYADTIIINNQLSFPQTNVTITCRHLLIEDQGTLSTTPEANPQPFAVGTGANPRKAGANAETAGNLTLLCHTIENKRPDTTAIFCLTGAKGQDGEVGGLKEVKTDSGYPVNWNDIKKKIINHDHITGNDSNWAWPDVPNTNKIYFADISAINLLFLDDKDKELRTTHGDRNKANQDNGPDAIASGPGGNGGNSGKLSYLDFNKAGKTVAWELKGGSRGMSKPIEGGKRIKDSEYFHYRIGAWHKDVNYALNKIGRTDMEPFYWQLDSVGSHDGNSAKNDDGKDGTDGNAEKLPADKSSWMHPVLLETMLQFAKTAFRDGERQRAKWILSGYTGAIKTLPDALKQEMRTAAAVREIEFYARRLDQNLDFYGYPPGWIPRLSVLSNLKVIKDSRRDLAQLIFFGNRLLDEADNSASQAKDLEVTIKELKKGLTNAQADISTAFAELPEVQNKINALEGQIRDQLTELRNLKKKIEAEIKDKAQAQALFTGSFQILAGVCSLVPVGQPYLGQLGGGILDRISEIDIDAENPLKEGLSFAGGLSDHVGAFYKDNKDKFKADLTSGMSKEVEKATKELNDFNDDVSKTTADLKEAEKALNETFQQQEISLMRDKMSVLRDMNSSKSDVVPELQDYADMIAYIEELQKSINNAREIAEADKKTLSGKLDTLKTNKGALAKRLKAAKEAKSKREKSVETAGKAIKGFTEGISAITGGIQTMMVEFDENDPKVKARLEKIMGSVYKKDYETINKKVAEINKQKLPLTERLQRLEQKISEGVQYINNNMVQWFVLNEQRVLEVQHDLLPATKLYLKGMVQRSWDLLMQECYYLTKSYQYRFIEKIDPLQHGIKEMITDIKEFSKVKDPASNTESEFKKLFDDVLKSQFKRLAYDLLIKLQGSSAKISEEVSVPVIDYKNPDGRVILDELNTYGRAAFRLEDIKSSKHGTDKWYHYRIIKITFQHIVVEADDPNVSFDFGIRHSGDSIIRTTDEKCYFFTSRSSQKSEKKLKAAPKSVVTRSNGIDLQVQSWNAAYNGSQRDRPGGPLVNEKESGLDQQLLYEFLSEFELKKEYDEKNKPYKDHYPGGASELMLIIYDNSNDINFKIRQLEFKVDYEVLR